MSVKIDKTVIKTFNNPYLERDYTVLIRAPEFTCLCPRTGQPDFATFLVSYVPNKYCVELKSFKLYIYSFREKGMFHEAVTNQVLNDLVNVVDPRFIRVTAKFNVRGGIYTDVIVEYQSDNWIPSVKIKRPAAIYED